MSKGKKKKIGWFKANNSSLDHIEQSHVPLQAPTNEVMIDEQSNHSIDTETPNTNLLSKDNQDKIALDVLVSIENVLRDRQLILYKNKGLGEQLYTLNEITDRLKEEHVKKDQVIHEKNKEIRALESNLTNRQMKYDQLLEDYKEYQATSTVEYEKTSNLLEIENNKYNKLSEEAASAQYKSMLKTNELEERIRTLEIENQGYIKDYQKALDDKDELMQTINDFTERMSFSFSPKTDVSNSQD